MKAARPAEVDATGAETQLLSAGGHSGEENREDQSTPEWRPSEQQVKPFLDLPPPISRASSPGTLSNISTSEWHNLHSADKNDSVRHASTWRQKFKAFWIRNLGLFYMLLANVFGTAMNVTVRILEVEGNGGKGLHPFQVLFVRMGITAILSSTYMYCTRTPHFPFGLPEVRWLLVARGLGGFFGVFGMYYSLLYLPISDATIITYLTPGLSCWACSLLISEPFTRVDKIGTFISLAGVIFIARPASLLTVMLGHNTTDTELGKTPTGATTDVAASGNSTSHISGEIDFGNITPSERVGAVGLALVGVMGAVAAVTTIRWIGKRAHPLISVNYFAVWCTLVSIVMQLILPGVGFILPSSPKEWGLLFFLGVCGFIMQFLLASGLSYEKSGRATNILYTSILFALASDKIFFDTSPGVYSIIGSVLIMGAAISMALQKAQPAPDKDLHAEVDSEEDLGLVGNMEGQDATDERMPMQEVQMRTLR